MSAIEASSVGVKTMADGTLRVTMDIEPRYAQDAFALFGAPGTPMALAALKPTKLDDTPAEPERVPDKPKGGPLAKLAGMWCNDERFCAWLTERGDFKLPLTPPDAAQVMRVWCCVDSRAELDNNKGAAERFDSFIRAPYMAHLASIGVTT